MPEATALRNGDTLWMLQYEIRHNYSIPVYFAITRGDAVEFIEKTTLFKDAPGMRRFALVPVRLGEAPENRYGKFYEPQYTEYFDLAGKRAGPNDWFSF